MDWRKSFFSIIIIFLLLLYFAHVICSYPNERVFNLAEFLRLRCSLNPNEQVITTWKGSAYLHLYQMPVNHVFDIIGMNIARCLNDSKNQEIILTTRETQLYVDVNTGKKLITWTNPYTGNNVSVMHVANDPVQSTLSTSEFSINGYLSSENQIILPTDINLFYPNPLFQNETLRYYSKEKFYQAGEYFKFFTTLNQITDENLTQVNQMDLSWTRVSPILPWMNMSTQYNGTLVFSAQGTKVSSLTQIDQILLDEIINRIPIYQNAPTCQLNASSETSWTYFKKYFSQYLSNTQEFPIPKSKEDIPCVHY
ncbi:unnamed protein product [Rotaria magnacalcarata]|uniref:Uncharacterized protein n=1 Tax=Rotaria magnacalcarata TaxID=392030 RepID=A0A816UA02_9BILA|nr:unnamed protein product [Rotaria magnacalcarata]CAF2205489.1 unnamed protein product [Rotaria magnacalcarata]CAF3962398.1 unnamed protein product [Rotaria magnacalcarata]CAF4151634.1 unnamed protein product [Rotaria magnacalcarata]